MYVYIYTYAQIFVQHIYKQYIIIYLLFVSKYIYRLISSFLMFLRLPPQTSPKKFQVGHWRSGESYQSRGLQQHPRLYTCSTWRWGLATEVSGGPNSYTMEIKQYIFMFPKIGVPPNHPILIGLSIINHPFWGTPIFGNTHMNGWKEWPWKKQTFAINMIGADMSLVALNTTSDFLQLWMEQ